MRETMQIGIEELELIDEGASTSLKSLGLKVAKSEITNTDLEKCIEYKKGDSGKISRQQILQSGCKKIIDFYFKSVFFD